MILFKELLASNDMNSRDELLRQAQIDIPPALRAEIWAEILSVKASQVEAIYRTKDKDSETNYDKQINLDVPRCHQYHPQLSSTEGHRKMKRILRGWVSSNQGTLEYWQGLDSVLAPFLVLNFDNEAKAFCCLDAFVKRYLHEFYAIKNQRYMEESQLIYK